MLLDVGNAGSDAAAIEDWFITQADFMLGIPIRCRHRADGIPCFGVGDVAGPTLATIRVARLRPSQLRLLVRARRDDLIGHYHVRLTQSAIDVAFWATLAKLSPTSDVLVQATLDALDAALMAYRHGVSGSTNGPIPTSPPRLSAAFMKEYVKLAR